MTRLNMLWASLALILVLACGAQEETVEVVEDPLAEGKQLLEEGEFEEAQAFFEGEIAAAAPETDAELHFLAGQAAAMGANYEQGVEHLNKALELNPETAAYYDWLGRIYGAQARVGNLMDRMQLAPKVKENFEKAYELNPDNPETQFFLGTFYLVAPYRMGGDRDKGKAFAEELLDEAPLSGHRLMAQYHVSMSQPDEAEAQYKEALALAPEDPQSHTDLGSFYLSQKQYEQALEHFEKALEFDPEFQAALAGIGEVALKTMEENYDRGVEALTQLSTLEPTIQSPNLGDAHHTLATLYDRKGEEEKARAAYERAAELGNIPAYKTLEKLKEEQAAAEAADEATTPTETTEAPEAGEDAPEAEEGGTEASAEEPAAETSGEEAATAE